MAISTPKNITPQIKVFTIQELQRLALLQLLADAGVEDPAALLETHDVAHMATYKAGALAICITDGALKQKPVDGAQPAREAQS